MQQLSSAFLLAAVQGDWQPNSQVVSLESTFLRTLGVLLDWYCLGSNQKVIDADRCADLF